MSKCKYIVVLGDGMPDYKIEALENKTPLEAARTPNMDFLARKGEVGMVATVPQGYPPGSDVANLSVMGYEPEIYYTGRSPLEAVSMGVALEEEDVAFRCNLVTLSQEQDFAQKVMVDYSAGEITTSEASQLIEEVNRNLRCENIIFYPGISYRHLMVWKGGAEEVNLTPPHDISDKKIGSYLPRGEEKLMQLMKAADSFLPAHPVNQDRERRRLNPANCLWFWGQGKKPVLTPFEEKYGLTGSVISAVDLIKGIGICAGLKVVEVPGATGNIHTDFIGKARAALQELKDGNDYVYIHIEAPDEAGHQGDLETKIRAIEEIDQKVLGEIINNLEGFENVRIMFLSDHPTPLALKTHTAEPVPFLLYDHRKNQEGTTNGFHEETAAAAQNIFFSGVQLLDYFLQKK
ncbi:cofactor-independent phosphoglycerate mutase [Candidatus Contubernalis alkaliaceticus]|uniref:cofactor-independent phosphoglycerate mutase n=1 Tax=Candidatus Contubernalis alkaliaceticus TaxID=338645 RepID=UPI001F4BE459|nr:cofactor-independent phosphoglycerate mutase [Candidatus Contubernalis alkalaceticus]UNC91432.1 cofactor-independent phosphoglycerate mutase [Candidatus Contubernalis alkalaceticus]